MRAVMVMFDSLNRHMLPPYGGGWIHAPNFSRLAARTVAFDASYVCSMPCMPARRDLHTARPNFLHRSWGPIEPFDDSMPQMLRDAGVHTHLATDHYHYFEDGGGTYHSRYSTWEFFRGQEGDAWTGRLDDVPAVKPLGRNANDDAMARQDRINRARIRDEHEMPQARTFAAGLEFLRHNRRHDRWMLHIETFDPHEPFFSPRRYKDLYPAHYDAWRRRGGGTFDWPFYRYVRESPDEVEHLRHEYASLVSMCDARLGDVLDAFDAMDLWKDTMLIVWTDHGFLLGEHDCWAKIWMPFYEEVARTPLFVWDPRTGGAGERRGSLVQPSIDLPVTLLRAFGVEPTERMLGRDLTPVLCDDAPTRDAGLFGVHGGQVNVTDGRYVYMRGPANAGNRPLANYTMMPTHMRSRFGVEELQSVTLAEPFDFTRGCRTLRIPAGAPFGADPHPDRSRTLLWDIHADPRQQRPLSDPAVEARMVESLRRLMAECDAPAEQYERLGLA